MKMGVGAWASRRLLVASLSILLPGLVLGYVGVRSFAERTNGLRTTYTATTALVRDRLLADLSRLESNLGAEIGQPRPQLDDPALGQAWLRHVADTNQWLVDPFLLRIEGGTMTTSLSAGWSRSSPERATDPLAASSKLSAIIQDAEAAEFVDGRLDRALQMYRDALGLAVTDSARGLAMMRIGRMLFKLKRFEEGIAQYRDVTALPADAVDSHGRPFAVNALMEIADGLDALERPIDKPPYLQHLLQLVVEHPWNVAEGYGYYLAHAVASAPASAGVLRTKAAELMRAASEIEWLDREIPPRLEADLKHGVWNPQSTCRIAARRDHEVALIGCVAFAEDSADSIRTIFGYQIRPEYVAGPLLDGVLKSVDLGGQVTMRVSRDASEEPLAQAGLDTILPGWKVGLFHRNGRSLDQLIWRERWIYGSLIAGLIGILIAGVTLTMRASAREAELSRLKTEFVANVSHELKTPLALIRMFGETLESGIVTDDLKRQEFYSIIRRESDRLTHLINNVLDVARIDAGTKQYTLVPADAVTVVREVIEAYGPLFDRLGFTVDVVLPAAPVLVPMDREAIAQAIVNLFQNAIKYSDERKEVTVALVTQTGMVRLSVSDRGVGIASTDVPHIFEKHYRARTNGQASPPGSGLGLSIVKHAMEAHGGRVEVESTPDHGSTFTLLMPQ